MKLSVVIPLHNEEKCLERVVKGLIRELQSNNIEYEIVLVNDNSTDSTPQVLVDISRKSPDEAVAKANGLGNVRVVRGFLGEEVACLGPLLYDEALDRLSGELGLYGHDALDHVISGAHWISSRAFMKTPKSSSALSSFQKSWPFLLGQRLGHAQGKSSPSLS